MRTIKKSELRQIIKEVIQELDTSTYYNVATARSGGREYNREKSTKAMNAAINKFKSDKDSFLFLQAIDENKTADKIYVGKVTQILVKNSLIEDSEVGKPLPPPEKWYIHGKILAGMADKILKEQEVYFAQETLSEYFFRIRPMRTNGLVLDILLNVSGGQGFDPRGSFLTASFITNNEITKFINAVKRVKIIPDNQEDKNKEKEKMIAEAIQKLDKNMFNSNYITPETRAPDAYKGLSSDEQN